MSNAFFRNTIAVLTVSLLLGTSSFAMDDDYEKMMLERKGQEKLKDDELNEERTTNTVSYENWKKLNKETTAPQYQRWMESVDKLKEGEERKRKEEKMEKKKRKITL